MNQYMLGSSWMHEVADILLLNRKFYISTFIVLKVSLIHYCYMLKLRWPALFFFSRVVTLLVCVSPQRRRLLFVLAYNPAGQCMTPAPEWRSRLNWP
jgi:hypothetical protein